MTAEVVAVHVSPTHTFSKPNATSITLLEGLGVEGDAHSGVTVKQIRCLANCNRACSAAIRRDGAWTYVFGGLEPTRDGAALIEGARLFARAADGLMPWRGRPDILKRGLIARVPPIDFVEEDTE